MTDTPRTKADPYTWDEYEAMRAIDAGLCADVPELSLCRLYATLDMLRAEAAAGPRDEGLTDDDRRFLAWCHERFAAIFHESPNLDWMQRLAALAKASE